MEPKIPTALIITYNSATVISALLDDLRKISPSSPVVVIDNASSDHTAEIIESHYPEVRLVKNDQNLGYAKAVNLGFDYCETAYVFLLNPDIRLPSPQCISALIDWMEVTPRCAASGPIQYMTGNKRYHLNFTTSYWSMRAMYGYLYYQFHHTWPSPKAIRVPLLNAGCIMLRRSTFLQIGKINPKYFLYGEDPDLGMKIKRYGYECWLLPSVYVIHLREKSLQTLSSFERLKVRWHALLNISDAFIVGWARILADKLSLTRKKPF